LRQIQAFKTGKHDFKHKDNVGQAVVQDGGSVDHVVSGSSVMFFSINKCFQAGKWVANHL